MFVSETFYHNVQCRRSRGGAANNFFKNGLFEKWINNTYFFYITTIFLWKVYYNAILDHLEAWVFKIAPSGQTMVGPPGDTEL